MKSNTLSARERILHTAHDLFYLDGIRATGIDRVIAKSGVTKVTFYRHFPSKNDLILAYLEHRHRLWMDWLNGALERHFRQGMDAAARLVAAMREWFESEEYRGCAFLNAVVELGCVLPQVANIAKLHKDEVTEVIARLLPESPLRQDLARSITMALDGAILRAQMERTTSPTLVTLDMMLRSIIGKHDLPIGSIKD